MGFSQTKGSGGVTVVQVDGQLIVGNRHELKDLTSPAPATSIHPGWALSCPSPSGSARRAASFGSRASTTIFGPSSS